MGKPTEYETGYSAGYDDAKAEAMLMLSELVQTVGDNAVEILLRNEPEAITTLRTALTAANARADAAEAALAAQIAADARIADDYAAMRERQVADERAKASHDVDLPQVMRWQAGKVQSTAIAADIRAQPHDRTALDRHDAATRAKALREGIIEGMRIATFTPIEQVPAAIDAAILALIPKEGAK